MICSRTPHRATGEAQTSDLAISSRTLYQWTYYIFLFIILDIGTSMDWLSTHYPGCLPCVDPESLSERVQLWRFISVCVFSQLMRGSKYCDKRAIIGPPAKRLYMTFHWRADRGPNFMLNWFANLTFPSQHANSANHRPLSETLFPMAFRLRVYDGPICFFSISLYCVAGGPMVARLFF